MKHKHKRVDRMLGEVDLVPVPARQKGPFGWRTGTGGDYGMALDISEIHGQHAESREASVRDGSTGELSVPGNNGSPRGRHQTQRRAVPLPLLTRVFSPAAVDFVRQPHDRRSAFDRLCAATPRGPFGGRFPVATQVTGSVGHHGPEEFGLSPTWDVPRRWTTTPPRASRLNPSIPS